MLLMIRCPKCRAAARVEEADLGLTVQCPRCADTYAAVEEAELIAPGPKSAPGTELADRPDDTPPPRPRRPPPEPPPGGEEDEQKPRPTTDPDAQFDPHAEPPGSLPASVLVGLALLPFLIPILWVIAPIVVGQEPVLSLASALALAVSASVLCLAVIYTVDWRPGTRIKGVLLLVVLSYITGVGLYFMQKEWIDRVQQFFGGRLPWVEFEPPGTGYRVQLPTKPVGVQGQQPLVIVPLACHQAQHSDRFRRATFVVGSSNPRAQVRPGDPPLGSDAWFKLAADAIAVGARVQGRVRSEVIDYQGRFPGRELDCTLHNGHTRILRLFVIKERVYYLAVEGPGVAADHEDVRRFFDEFEVPDAAN